METFAKTTGSPSIWMTLAGMDGTAGRADDDDAEEEEEGGRAASVYSSTLPRR